MLEELKNVDVDEVKENVEAKVFEIKESLADLDIDAHFGGQPIYYYVLAVE